MRIAFVAIVLFGSWACTTEPPAPPDLADGVAQVELTSYELERAPSDEADLCSLASALPSNQLCSLVCDPDAFAARLAADGMSSGTCLQIRCELTPTTVVSVGVCAL